MISPSPTTYRNRLIVPIAVVPPAISGKEPRLICPPFILPPGDWVIVWNLVTIDDSELTLATFPADHGIDLMLGQAQNFNSSTRVSETQWRASVSNGAKADQSKAFPLFYIVSFHYPAGGAGNAPALFTSKNRHVIRHDPTIVVSQDPVEPP
ncbi:MAG: hypothetical protein SF066_13620 [Thermoanaerobaculia bacterium]|nr:hypothetical protein [Thermoanaerobaculia bacterium]